jgi:predicted GIY-YIG superfamily endonuclease
VQDSGINKNGKLYVGITTDLENRLRQHGNIDLLYKEGPYARDEAVTREKQIKGWRRDKKLTLIEKGPDAA